MDFDKLMDIEVLEGVIRSTGIFYDSSDKQYDWNSYGKSWNIKERMNYQKDPQKRIRFQFFGDNMQKEKLIGFLEGCIVSRERLELGAIGILNSDKVRKLSKEKNLPKPETIHQAIFLAEKIREIAQERGERRRLDREEPTKRVKLMREKVKAKNVSLHKQIEMIKMSVRNKPDWKKKFVKEDIQMRYRGELLAQGADEEAIFQAFSDLLDSEIIQNVFDLEVALDNAILCRDSMSFLSLCWAFLMIFLYSISDVVPQELKESLSRGLDRIADAKEKDFHPGSEGLVQDLIHPSLYPFQFVFLHLIFRIFCVDSSFFGVAYLDCLM